MENANHWNTCNSLKYSFEIIITDKNYYTLKKTIDPNILSKSAVVSFDSTIFQFPSSQPAVNKASCSKKKKVKVY